MSSGYDVIVIQGAARSSRTRLRSAPAYRLTCCATASSRSPRFSEVYVAALEGLHGQITTASGASAALGSLPALIASRRQDCCSHAAATGKRLRKLPVNTAALKRAA